MPQQWPIMSHGSHNLQQHPIESAIGPTKKLAPAPSHIGHRKRLRERFLTAGPEALADYELLEILLFSARPIGDVKPLAKALLATFGSFSSVVHADIAALMRVEGINEAAVTAVKLIKVAAERLLREDIIDRPVIQSWGALLDYCRLHIGHSAIEEFHVLFLDHKHGLITDETLQKGTNNQTAIYPREVVKRALELGAASIILAHNHPSGDVTPSKADIAVTRQIVEAARSLDITVHDHLIMGKKKHYSFRSSGLL